MSAPLALGWQLATRSTPHGRIRAGIIAVVTAVGTTALLSILALVVAVRANAAVSEYGRSTDTLGMVLAGGALLAVVLPVLMGAVTAGRMSAALRARRLARLRLLGMTPRQLGLVGVGETAPWALAGWALGVGLHLALLPALSRLEIGSRRYAVADLVPGPLLVLGSLAVPLVLVLGALGGRRARDAAVVTQARSVVVRRPGLWRLAPLVLGVVLLVAATRATWEHTWTEEVLVLAGAALAVVGAVLVPPVVVRLLADVLVRVDRPAATIAGRRLQAQPGALTRVLSALVVGLVVATAGQALVADVQGLPQYRAVLHQRQVESSVEARIPAGMPVADFQREVEQVGGIRGLGVLTAVATPRQVEDLYSGEPHEVSVVISSCADLAVVQPRLEGCRDDRAVWVEDPDSRIFQPVLGAVPLQAPPDYAAGPDADPDRDPGPGPVVAEVEVAEVLALPARVDSIENRQVVDTVLVPRALLTGDELAELSVLGSRATVVADPRHDLAGELRAVGVDAFSAWDVAEFERLQRYIDTVRLLTVVVLALGLASFLLGMVDRVLERRAELSRLRLLGTPVSTLRAAHWLEVAVPLVLGCGLALVLGGAIGTAYLDLVHATTRPPERRHLSWTYLLGVASAAGVGCLLVAAATSLGLGGRPRPDLVRQA